MNKKEYTSLLSERPWDDIDEYFGDLNLLPKTEKVRRIDIDPEEWIQFTIDNFNLADQNYECPKLHYVDDSNWISIINNRLGRNEHNSFELNWGKQGNTNEKLLNLLGEENISKLEIEQDCILVRLLAYTPGHGVPWHKDSGESHREIFPEIKSLNESIRLWFPITDWKNGQAFQIGTTVLTHWNAGDVWHIPWGVPHASANFGYDIKYSVSLTGKRKGV